MERNDAFVMVRFAAPAGDDGVHRWICDNCGYSVESEGRYPPMQCSECKWVDGRWRLILSAPMEGTK